MTTRSQSPESPIPACKSVLGHFIGLKPLPGNTCLFTATHQFTGETVTIRKYSKSEYFQFVTNKHVSRVLCGNKSILELLEIHVTGNEAYLVFAPIEETLEMHNHGFPHESAVLVLMSLILRGLETLHRLKIPWTRAHPSNIVRCGNRYVLTDFDFSFSQTATHDSLMEAYRPARSSKKSAMADDVYAVMLIFLDMMIGRSKRLILGAEKVQEFVDCLALPKNLETVVKQALDENPDKRPSVEAVLKSFYDAEMARSTCISPGLALSVEEVYSRITRLARQHRRIPGGLEVDIGNAYLKVVLEKRKDGMYVRLTRRHGLIKAFEDAKKLISQALFDRPV